MSLEPGIPAEKHCAIAAFLGKSSVPLYRAEPGQQVRVGTGTLFTVNGRHYLITAAHVLESIPAGCVGLPTGPSARAITTLGPSLRLRAALEEHDIALVALEDDEVIDRLVGSWTFLQPRNLGVPRHPEQLFIVCGYPGPCSGDVGGPEPLVVMSNGYRGEIDRLAVAFDPAIDLLLEYPPNPVDLDSGEHVDAPRLQGLSGASVWVMEGEEAGEVWTAESQLRVVAIQSAAKLGSYIRAKRWHLFWSAFGSVDEQAAIQVRAALEASVDE